jgi:hypothetical protein
MRKLIFLIVMTVLFTSMAQAVLINPPDLSTFVTTGNGGGPGFGAPSVEIPEEELQELYEQNQDSIAAWMKQDFGDLTEQQIYDLQKATILANLDVVKDEINVYDMPKAVVRFLGNERISVYFDGEYEMGATLEKGVLTRLSDAAQIDPTLTVYVHDEIFQSIMDENLDVGTAFSEDHVVLEGHGFSGNVKAAAANTAVKFYKWFK